MPAKAITPTARRIEGESVELGALYPKQREFCMSRCRYTGYGGARGGGKSYTVRWKAKAGALRYPGIRILIVRQKYPDLENSLIQPLVSSLPAEVASYNSQMHLLTFCNGSTIKFGHYNADSASIEYQGQEYDWIFIDEATQFTEEQFRTLGACLRGVTNIPRRMYLTANPGGVGHLWFKRLFVDRDFDVAHGERPEDYQFIPATVDDNPGLLESSPDYKNMLDLLPEDVRRAWRYGDWDALAGTFFPEFGEIHREKAFLHVPDDWIKVRAFDYGLDMFACLWAAVDFAGHIHVYREVQQSGTIVSDAAKLALSLTPPGEAISMTIAPPDMWNRQKDTGKSMAELFAENGMGLVKASNNRVQGWMSVKEALKPLADGKPGLLVSEDCVGLARCLPALMHDDQNPSDCATEPHQITHITDALRYLCVTRMLTPSLSPAPPEDWGEAEVPYDEAMTGGEAPSGYLSYGGR
jgi:phage terminase large subunit